ncbi:MAG: hypothetical protein ACI8S6_003262 [Myxococcota bacterium]|jgi:hypothetical protein
MSLGYSDIVMFTAIGALAINYALVRIPGWADRPWLFWSVQLINLLAGAWMFSSGIPDLKGTADIANKMFGLLFFFHIVSNNRRLQRHRRNSRVEADSSDDARRAKIRAALRAGEDDPT